MAWILALVLAGCGAPQAPAAAAADPDADGVLGAADRCPTDAEDARATCRLLWSGPRMPSAAELGTLGMGCGAELVPFLLVVGLWLWGRSVAKRHPGRGWQLASWLPFVGLVVQHVGLFFTVIGLVQAFDAVGSVSPESRALALSNGINSAMWATALGMGISVLLYVGCTIAFAIGTLRPPTRPS